MVLYHRPSTGEVDRVPSKELLIVRIANRRIDIMIVKNGPKIRVGKDAPARSQFRNAIKQVQKARDLLSARSINIVMALKNNCSSTCRAGGSSRINLRFVSLGLKVISGPHTKSPVADDDRQTLILYSSPVAGLDVS